MFRVVPYTDMNSKKTLPTRWLPTHPLVEGQGIGFVKENVANFVINQYILLLKCIQQTSFTVLTMNTRKKCHSTLNHTQYLILK